LKIRRSLTRDNPEIENIHREAFGEKKGPEIAQLVKDLFNDESALPIHSLVAVDNEKIIGHILFTNITITGTTETVSAQILAPLAVLPEAHGKGVGGRLIKDSLHYLKELDVELVFVLGHPGYYPRFGFTPAGGLGYEAPYHIPVKHADAWMVQELCPGIIEKTQGKVQCSHVLNKPEHWRE